MLDVILSNQFKRDLKLMSRRRMDLELLDAVVTRLASGEALDEKHSDHALTGNYAGFRECHIKPDWLLIYRINGRELYLFLSRTGTHSDLF